jgi:GDP-D-mannose dehydratase
MSAFWDGRNVLITGCTGFVGSWLAETLVGRGANVNGFVRSQSETTTKNIDHLLADKKIKLHRGDLNDSGSIAGVIRDSKSEVVFHLAAQSFVPQSFESPVDTFRANVIGTTNVLDAVKQVDKSIMVHFAGSSEEYGLVIVDDSQYKRMMDRYKVILPAPEKDGGGRVVSEVPIKETNPMRTVGISPYGCSKRMAEDICRTYASCYDMNVYVTRAFNHTGPKRGREFVSSRVTEQVADGVKNGKKEIVLGNLDSVRDFSDVRDIVRGYMAAVERGVPGDVYNLCSGRGTSIRQMMEMAISIAKRDFGLGHEMKYVADEKLLRPAELPVIIGDCGKARRDLGWETEVPLEKTLKDMIEFYCERV